MSAMSDLDIMVREGDRTAEDFEARGFDRERAEAFAELAKDADAEPLTLGDVLDRIIARDDAKHEARKRAERALAVLRDFDLIDAEGFYTIYETDR